MEETSVDQLRNKLIDVLKRHDVKKAALFGSVARGEDTEESDIDLLIEFEGRKSLLDLAGLQLELQDVLSRKIHVLTYKSLHPRLKERIVREQVTIL